MPDLPLSFSRFRSSTVFIAPGFFFLVIIVPFLLPEFWNWIDSEKYYLSFSQGVTYGGFSYWAYLSYASLIKNLGLDYNQFQWSILLLCSFSLCLLGIVAGHTNKSHILFLLLLSPYFYRLIFAFQRQAIAISLVFIGLFLLLVCNSLFLSVSAFLFAALFHLSSVFILFAFFSVRFGLFAKSMSFVKALRIPRLRVTSRISSLLLFSSLFLLSAFFSLNIFLVLASKAASYRPELGYSLFVFILISSVLIYFTRSLYLSCLFLVFSFVFGFARTSMLLYFVIFAIVSFSPSIFSSSQLTRYSNGYYRAFACISILSLPVTINILASVSK